MNWKLENKCLMCDDVIVITGVDDDLYCLNSLPCAKITTSV
jgi:hypothetical protein